MRLYSFIIRTPVLLKQHCWYNTNRIMNLPPLAFTGFQFVKSFKISNIIRIFFLLSFEHSSRRALHSFNAFAVCVSSSMIFIHEEPKCARISSRPIYHVQYINTLWNAGGLRIAFMVLIDDQMHSWKKMEILQCSYFMRSNQNPFHKSVNLLSKKSSYCLATQILQRNLNGKLKIKFLMKHTSL